MIKLNGQHLDKIMLGSNEVERVLAGTKPVYGFTPMVDDVEAYEKVVPDGAMKWATLDKVGAKTLVWNQMANFAAFDFEKDVFRSQNFRFNVGMHITEGHKYLYSHVVSNAVQDKNYPNISIQFHANPADKEDNAFQLYDASMTNGMYLKVITAPVSMTATNSKSSNGSIWFYVYIPVNAASGTKFTLDNMMFIDLTQMFGAGNEPTADEFRAMFPADYYPCSEPTLMSYSPETVASKGRNLANGYLDINTKSYRILLSKGTYTVSANEIKSTQNAHWYLRVMKNGSTVSDESALSGLNGFSTSTFWHYGRGTEKYVTFTINDDYEVEIAKKGEDGTTPIMLVVGETAFPYIPYRDPITTDISTLVQKYFPDGMHSAGAVHDEIDLERGVAVQRIGSVDLGELVFTTTSGYTSTFYNNMSFGPVSANSVPVCQRYVSASPKTSVTMVSNEEICVSTTYKRFMIRDDAYNGNIKGFTDSVKGLLVYYELAEPIEIPIAPEELTGLSTLNVEAGGTLTFNNGKGDDYRIPLPNQETYNIFVK